MKIEFAPLRLADVLHVCQHMRQQDWQEIVNLLPSHIDTPDAIAMACMSMSRFGLVAYLDGEPIAVAQFAEILNGTWRAGMFGTDDFRKVALPLVGELLRVGVPYAFDECGMTYCEALADAVHAEAHKLLEFVGFENRGILEEYGSRGRDIAHFVLTRRKADDVLRNGRWRRIIRAAGAEV